MKAETVVRCLEEHHKDWISIRELRLSSGFENAQRIDLWCIDPSPANGNQAISYEVKVSRQDFQRDSFEKQRGARLFSDKFYYATPVGLLKPGEIPDWAGLVEISPTETVWKRYKIVIPSPKMDKFAPSWGLVCSMLRRTDIEGMLNSGQEKHTKRVTEIVTVGALSHETTVESVTTKPNPISGDAYLAGIMKNKNWDIL